MLADGRARIRADLVGYRPGTPLTTSQDPHFQGPDGQLTTDAVLLHVLEELAQYHGQLEVLRSPLGTIRAARLDHSPGVRVMTGMRRSHARANRRSAVNSGRRR